MSVQIGSSRIVDFIFIMPPSFPMVSLVRNYVRVVHMPQFVGAKMEAELLIELLTSWTIILWGSPGSFDSVRILPADVIVSLIRPPCTSAAKAAVCSSVGGSAPCFR